MAFTSESHEFAARDFIGGDAALDFVNTVTGRDQEPRDWLDSYARLLEWATLVRLLPEKNLRALAKKMHGEPGAAGRALIRAKELREELFALVSAVASGNGGAAPGRCWQSSFCARAGAALYANPGTAAKCGEKQFWEGET